MAREHIVITGGTGAFGKYLLKQFLSTNSQITVLVRGENDIHARGRLEELLGNRLPRVNILSSDLERADLGLNPDSYFKLINSTTAMIHAAASTRFNLPMELAIKSNVQTTKNILHLAKQLKNLTSFGYIGTAFAAGKQKGLIREQKLKNKGFVNNYDESKYEAEALVRFAMQEIPIAIYRPSLIIAPDSPRYNAALIVLGLIKKNLLPILPGKPEDPVDIISAEDASQAIFKLFNNKFERSKTYNIASGKNAPLLNEIVELANMHDLEIKYTGYEEAVYDKAVGQLILKRPELKSIYGKIDSYIRYLLFPKIIDTKNTQQALGRDINQDNVIQILKKRIQYD